MSLPTLYRRTKTGAIQEWSIVVADDRFRTYEGLVGGVMTFSADTICKPKNVGRKNATTAAQQAQAEARSKWQKKLDKGYVENLADVDVPRGYVEPMLAQSWDQGELPYPVHVQPKLDGMRCIARADGLWGRNGKPLVACPHISDALAPLFAADPSLVLDGELYNHELKDNFNAIISLVKKTKPTPAALADSARVIQYHVYDLPSFAGAEFGRRWTTLRGLVGSGLNPVVQLVETYPIIDRDALDYYYAQFLEAGFEGQMIRLRGDYEFGRRSKTLLKRKEFQDAEFPILEFLEGIGGRAGTLGKVVVTLPDGRTNEAGARGSHDYWAELWADRESYRGRLATIRFQGYTPDGKLRFPVMTAIRDYE